MVVQQQQEIRSGKDEAIDLLRAELKRLAAEVHDIQQKLKASQQQVEQLSQHNAAVIGEVRRIESALDTTPRINIKDAYTEALNTQQRLLTLRSQMQKLQSEGEVAQRTYDTAEKLIELLNRKDPNQEELLNAKEMIIRVIDAQEEERERLARALHDGPAHSLTNFILQAEISLKWFEKDPMRAREELIKLKNAANHSFQNVRAFIADLRPMMLGDLGLAPTLKRYLKDLKTKSELDTQFDMIGREMRYAEYLEVLIFRGIMALVSNARDQRNATMVSVTLEMNESSIRATVEDNGRGFGTGRLTLDANNSEALGLGALQERVHLVGGTLNIDSAGGMGAKIQIEVPADSAAAA